MNDDETLNDGDSKGHTSSLHILLQRRREYLYRIHSLALYLLKPGYDIHLKIVPVVVSNKQEDPMIKKKKKNPHYEVHWMTEEKNHQRNSNSTSATNDIKNKVMRIHYMERKTNNSEPTEEREVIMDLDETLKSSSMICYRMSCLEISHEILKRSIERSSDYLPIHDEDYQHLVLQLEVCFIQGLHSKT